MSTYTDADVQATAVAIHLDDYGRWVSGPDPDGTPWGTSREQSHRADYERKARAVLDAVASGIAARALREAAQPMIANCDKHGQGERASIEADCDWCSAFGVDQDWVERLTTRADTVERT